MMGVLKSGQQKQNEIKAMVWLSETEMDTSPIELPRLRRWMTAMADSTVANAGRTTVPAALGVSRAAVPPPPTVTSAPELARPARAPRGEGSETGDLREQVLTQPESAARLVRTMLREESSPEGELPRRDRVALSMVALGQAVSGEVMKHLTDDEIEAVTQRVAVLNNTTAEVLNRALEEIQQHLDAAAWVGQGGLDFARGMLERACGPAKAREILERAITQVTSGFHMLKDAAPDQIAPLISHEHPQTIALILSQLDPAQASGILAQLPERTQADVAYRIATMENITPNVIKQIETGLESSLRDLLGGNLDVGGAKVVADILNLSGSSVESKVLAQLDAQDPEVGEAIRNLMFVFDDIAKLTDRDVQTLLREIDQKDLVVALKAASEDLKNKVVSNISEQVRGSIAEEMELLGPMPLTEVEEVQLRIVKQVRQLEEQGAVTIVRGNACNLFV